jgi:uncharacterized protein
MATTHVEEENATQVRRGFNAFSVGDMTSLSELFTPNATWHGPATGVIAGDYIGRDNIFKMFGQLGEETSGTFHASPGAFAAAGDHVFVQVMATGRRNGKSIESDEVLVFTLNDGKVTRVRLYLSDVQEDRDFWS